MGADAGPVRRPVGLQAPLTPPAQEFASDGSQGSTLCLSSTTPGPIPVTRGPLRVNRSLSIQALADPFTPVFDCAGRSNWVIADVARDTGSFFNISGLHVRNGRAYEGGGLAVRADRVYVTNMTFRGTVSDGVGPDCHKKAMHGSFPEDCFRGGGALFVEAGAAFISGIDVVQSRSERAGGAIAIMDTPMIQIDGVTAREVRSNGCGGAIAVGSTCAASQSHWLLRRVSATVSRASVGAVVALMAGDHPANSAWSVEHLSGDQSTAHSDGGVLSIRTDGAITNSTVSVKRVTATSTRAAAGSGGAIHIHAGEVANSTVSVQHVTATHVSAGWGGGAIYVSMRRVMDSAWKFEHIAADHTNSTKASGGVIHVWMSDAFLGSEWSLRNLTAHQTRSARGNAGAVYIFANDAVVNSKWSLEDVATNATSADRRGGVFYVSAGESVTDSVWSVRNVTATNTRAQVAGGTLSLSVSQGSNLSVALSSWVIVDSYAGSEGGVCFLEFPGSEADTRSTVVMEDFNATRASAVAYGGFLTALSAPPAQVPWRTLGSACQPPHRWCNCSLAPYWDPSTLPLHYNAVIRGRRWRVRHGRAEVGGLVAVENVAASFHDLDVVDVGSAFSGGLLDVSGKADVSFTRVSATAIPLLVGSRESLGALLRQSQSPGNFSATSVAVTPAARRGLHSPVLISAGALLPSRKSRVSQVFAGCPLGYVVHDKSRGNITISAAPFYETRQGYRGTNHVCPVYNQTRQVRVFPYVSFSLGCKWCPSGTYTLTPQAWVSRDSSSQQCDHGSPGQLLCPNVPPSEAACKRCPIGANCTGGADVTAQLGRWGTTVFGDPQRLISRFPVLAFGYACAEESCQTRYDACAGRRTGFGCGHCGARLGEALGTVGCIAAEECHAGLSLAAWLLLSAMVVGIAFIYFAFAGTARDGTRAGLATILFVLFQSESIVRANDQESMTPFAHFALLQPFVPFTRICLWRHMSSRAKAFLPVCCSMAALAALCVLFQVHKLAHGWGLRWCGLVKAPPSRARYTRSLIALFLAGYGALAGVAIQFLTVVVVEGYHGANESSWYQALTGEPWMQTWDQWVVALWFAISIVPAPLWILHGMARLRRGTLRAETYGIGIALPLPVWLATLHFRQPTTSPGASRARAMFETLSAPYKGKYWYWDAVLIFQRQLFASLSLFLSWDPVLRAFAMGTLSALLFYVHVHTRPFCSQTANHVESLALASLVTVCLSTVVTSYRNVHGVVASADAQALQLAATSCLVAVALAAFGAVLQAQQWTSAFSRIRQASGLDLPLLHQPRGHVGPSRA